MRVEFDVGRIREEIMRQLNDGLISSMHGLIIHPAICAGKAEALIELLGKSEARLSYDSEECLKLRELKSRILGR